eukprot:6461778-Heterocapsa_arctica.AAC.1
MHVDCAAVCGAGREGEECGQPQPRGQGELGLGAEHRRRRWQQGLESAMPGRGRRKAMPGRGRRKAMAGRGRRR